MPGGQALDLSVTQDVIYIEGDVTTLVVFETPHISDKIIAVLDFVFGEGTGNITTILVLRLAQQSLLILGAIIFQSRVSDHRD